jgi:hypothetical protein
VISQESGGIVERAQEALFGFSAGGIVDSLFGDDKNDAAVEAAKMREEGAKDAYERAAREEKNCTSKSVVSESNLKPKFEQIIKDVRNDLQIIKKMSAILLSKVGDSAPSEDTGTWIMDVFIAISDFYLLRSVTVMFSLFSLLHFWS